MDNPIITYYDNGNIAGKHWCENGKYHRLGGPAYISYYKNGKIESEHWFINGNNIEPPYDNYPLTKEQIVEMKLIYG